jgi:hypothetical protein
MPLVRPTFVGMHDKPASHGFAPNEMTQLALLGAASAEFSEDDARNVAQINTGKMKRLLIVKRHQCASRLSNILPRNPTAIKSVTITRQNAVLWLKRDQWGELFSEGTVIRCGHRQGRVYGPLCHRYWYPDRD